jgi:tetratricopeptide (TPR) repeat protein
MKRLSLKKLVLCGFAATLLLLAGGCSKEARSARHVARGDKELAAGQFERAELNYVSALRLAPTNGAAFLGAGKVYFTQGRMPQAYAFLGRALDFAPANPEVRLNLGRVCRAIGQLPQAWRHALQLLESNPADGEALLLLIESAQTGADMEECVRRVQAMTAATGTNSLNLLFARGVLEIHNKNLDKAEAEFQAAMLLDPASEKPHVGMFSVRMARHETDAAETALRKAAELAPPRSAARVNLAQFILQRGNASEAKQIATDLTKKAPDFMPAWAFLADMAFAKGDYDGCGEAIKQMLARDPSNYEALSWQARLSLVRGDGPAAVKQFEFLVQAFGTNAAHLRNLAAAQVETRQENQAIATLDRALASNTNNVEIANFRAALLIKQGSAAAAITSLRPLIERGASLPLTEQSRLPQSYSLLARAYVSVKDASSAVALFEALPRSFPSLPEASLEAGNGLASMNQTNGARRAYLDYVDRATNSRGILMAASGLARLQDTAKAREILEKLIASQPGFFPAIETLIRVDAMQGRFQEALERARAQADLAPASSAPRILMAEIYVQRALASAKKDLGESVVTEKLSKSPAAREDIKSAEAALAAALERDQNAFNAYNLLARIWVDTGREQEAIERLSAVTARTNDLTSHVQLALIHSQAGNHKAAAETYEKTLLFAPNTIEALNNLAGIYSGHIPMPDRAVELAQRARQIAPGSPAVADTLGWALCQKGDSLQALNFLEIASSALPDEPEVEYHLGMALYGLGRETLAGASLTRAAASSKTFDGKDEIADALAVLALDASKVDAGALPMLEKRLAMAPNDVIALSKMAEILEREKRFGEAAEKYQSILALTPNNGAVSYGLARLYADHLNQPDRASEAAKVARANSPEDPHVAALLGRLAMKSQNWTWAASLLEEASRGLPGDHETGYDFARAAFCVGRVTDAQQKFASLASLKDFAKAGDASVMVKIIAASREPADAAGLEAETDRLLAGDPNLLPALFLKAIVLEQKREFAKAAAGYERILSEWPVFTPALRNLAILCFERLQQDQKAYDLALKVRQADPSDARIARTLGILAIKRGENARGIQMLTEASLVLTDDAILFYHLGVAQNNAKSTKEAKESLGRAIQLGLPESLAPQAIRLVSEIK